MLLLLITTVASAQKFDTLGLGWSKTSVNAVIFRKNSIASLGEMTYTAYYDTAGYVVLGKKKYGEPWKMTRTDFKGNVADAHNSISLGVDGDGFVHMSWDHHATRLKYARSKAPRSVDLVLMPMVGTDEASVTYPEFHRMPNGNLTFFYRNGESGRGNLVMNTYDRHSQKWSRTQDNLIDGEGERNAYWQIYIEKSGMIHLSWVWRESPDVASNHDICYARSRSAGGSWENSKAQLYTLPINASNAEYAAKIPEQSELINQTSMIAAAADRPVIATYWRDAGSSIPQFRIVWYDGTKWKQEQVSQKKQPFSLKGAGTRKIPISRPLLVSKDMVIYRDNERGHMVTIARRGKKGWTYEDMIKIDDSSWEPSGEFSEGELKLFLQDVGQGDGEKLSNKKPTPVVIGTFRP